MASGYREIVRQLDQAGVTTIFGVMGEGNMRFIAEWTSEPSRRYVAARHEAGAVAMAAGFAHVSGKLGVSTVTHGPGVTNAITALTTATRAGHRVMLITGGIPPEASVGHTQSIDHREVAGLCGANYVGLDDPATASRLLASAIRDVLDRRATLLDARLDVQVAEWPLHPADPVALDPAARPDPASVEAAAAALASAREPVVVVGRGALRAGAGDELLELARHLGCPIATTLQAKDLYLGDPLAIGISGGFSSDLGRSVLERADCVLAVGASLNTWTTAGRTLFADAAVIHVDIAPSAIGRITPATTAVVGDALLAAQALRAALAERMPQQADRAERVSRLIADAPRSETDSIRGQEAMRALDRILPASRTIVVDGGHFMGYASMELSADHPQHFVWSSDFGSIGLGLSMAIGASLARPDDTTVLVVGDGGLTMSLGELDTVARLGLPLVIVVVNDSAYGAEAHIMRSRGLPEATALMAAPEFVAVAEALGIRAHRIDDLAADLAAVADRIAHPGAPVLLEIPVDHRELAPYFRRVLETH